MHLHTPVCRDLPQGYKTFFMLNSAEHEICPDKSQITDNRKFFLLPYLSMKISLLINMKMPTIVGIFISVSRENFMLSPVEHKIVL